MEESSISGFYLLKTLAHGIFKYHSSRRKWHTIERNVTPGDVVLVRDKDMPRYLWPIGIVMNSISSDDDLVRKVVVRMLVNGEPKTYVRPISELVVLIEQ